MSNLFGNSSVMNVLNVLVCNIFSTDADKISYKKLLKTFSKNDRLNHLPKNVVDTAFEAKIFFQPRKLPFTLVKSPRIHIHRAIYILKFTFKGRIICFCVCLS